MGRLLLAALLALALGACDLSSALDIETPAYEPQTTVRAVFEAGRPARVRVSVTRDPYAVDSAGSGLAQRPSRVDGRVVLLRDGALVEELRAVERTCYSRRTSRCDAATGQTVTTTEGPFPCGVFVGSVPIEAGATYTVRAEMPGLPSAAATVAVPDPPTVTATRVGGDRWRLRVRLTDPPGPGDRYAMALYREFDRTTVSVCLPGGAIDTLVVFPTPQVYRSDFATEDPVLLTGSREAGSSIHFVTFPDDAFDGVARDFDIEADAFGRHPGDTGAVRVQVAAITPELYDAFQILNFDLDENPFAERADLPLNVTGGVGRVGGVATAEVRFAGPGG
ncbi:DUF4249 family protein [Rubrivirga sp. IMCC45206]|uniref:DUF4249 family protein n=1 Tax=Rubrivirga sp. IMCC45206 TaxID=3391614 RepID=UPI00398FEC1B